MATPVNWWKKWKYVVEIDGVARAAFRTCSELRIEADLIEYREGGRRHPHKAPGLVKFPPVTLGRGKCADFDLYNWMLDTYKASSGTGMVPPNLYRNLDIVQQTEDGEEVERHRLFDCFCAQYSAGDWDNDASETMMEQAVIECDHWERVPSA